MQSTPVTLSDIFVPVDDGVDIKAQLDGKVIPDLCREIEELPDVAWSALSEEMQFAFAKALDIKLIDVVLGAWSKLKELRDYCGRKPDEADKPFSVALARHDVVSTHQPGIDILLGKKVIGQIIVDLELTLTLTGIILSIRDDHIVAIASGRFAGAGAIKYRGATLIERKTEEYEIPGKWTFDRPFPLPCRQDSMAA
jgi:hypothetical protein